MSIPSFSLGIPTVALELTVERAECTRQGGGKTRQARSSANCSEKWIANSQAHDHPGKHHRNGLLAAH